MSPIVVSVEQACHAGGRGFESRCGQEGETADANAELSSAKGQRDNQRGTNYILAVVLCSGSLFFAGMSKVGGSLRQQEVLLAIGWALFLGTVIWVANSPVSFSV
jgi:hypothetical protein